MTTTTPPATVADLIAELTHQRIGTWQSRYLLDHAPAVAALARLRRGAGRPAGQVPDLWDLIDISPLHEVRPAGRRLSEAELARAEEAVHVACTLWALHQQARSTGMHQRHRRDRPRGLGAAVRRLMPAGEIDEPLRKRLVRAGTSPNLPALAPRLRDIVTLLRRQEVRLDYALLAAQLYQWQWPGGPDTVRTAWGRSFHAWREEHELAPTIPAPAPAPDTTIKDAS
ncbi:type I-E CRISPR-associated protein Cse2/CasB [Streptomyces sp. NPDC056632]|uniref:type I-E CRISPR-associated protein Cse2/CasB n=1 Tax=Streptomyces sp. NPDC056632 TaxID=3345884 RepID=UPI0036BF65E4